MRKRDEVMEDFIQSFPQVYDQEMSKLKEMEGIIVHCLEHSSLGVTGESGEQLSKGNYAKVSYLFSNKYFHFQ